MVTMAADTSKVPEKQQNQLATYLTLPSLFKSIVSIVLLRLLVRIVAINKWQTSYEHMIPSFVNSTCAHNGQQVTLRRTPVAEYVMANLPRKEYTNEEMVQLLLGGKNGQIFLDVKVPASKKKYAPPTLHYLLNTERLCKDVTDLYYLMWVYSAPSNFAKRQALRETWAKPGVVKGFPSTTVFVLGLSQDASVNSKIKTESQQFGDIIHVDYIETYRNLSYKGITFIQWTARFCQNAKFVIKADDDVFIYVERLTNVLTDISNRIQKKSISEKVLAGQQIFHVRPPRTRTDKNGEKLNVPRDFLPGDPYMPTFVHGNCYILSNNMMQELYHASLHTPVFQIDDAFISGMLVGQVPGVNLMRIKWSGHGQFMHKIARTPRVVWKIWCQNLSPVIRLGV